MEAYHGRYYHRDSSEWFMKDPSRMYRGHIRRSDWLRSNTLRRRMLRYDAEWYQPRTAEVLSTAKSHFLIPLSISWVQHTLTSLMIIGPFGSIVSCLFLQSVIKYLSTTLIERLPLDLNWSNAWEITGVKKDKGCAFLEWRVKAVWQRMWFVKQLVR